MVRAARRLGFPALSLACIVTLGWPHIVRSAMYRSFYPLVAVDEQSLSEPPQSLVPLGYRAASPAELDAFHAAAAPAVAAVSDDTDRMRRLGDLIYSYHPAVAQGPIIQGGRERGARAILAEMQAGRFALCGHKTVVLAALWRSLGGDVRQVRFAQDEDTAWFAAHYGVEVYSPSRTKWFYYDATLNGYAVDEIGTPLSLVELNRRLATGDDVAMVASDRHFDWTPAEFLAFLRQNRLQMYSLNNELRSQDPDRRFGPLNFGYSVLSHLPRPLDRVFDAVTGDAERRYVIRPGAPAPASTANLHLSAIPIG